MNKVKSIYELLIILKKDISTVMKEKKDLGSIYIGMCGCAWKLFWERKITSKERDKLNYYIRENRPKPRINLKYELNDDYLSYFWSPSLIQPRLNWLTYHIKKNKPIN